MNKVSLLFNKPKPVSVKLLYAAGLPAPCAD
jgi:hypothetical protein